MGVPWMAQSVMSSGAHLLGSIPAIVNLFETTYVSGFLSMLCRYVKEVCQSITSCIVIQEGVGSGAGGGSS